MPSNHITPSLTGDGSSTLYSEKYGAHYHSIHGSVTEARHIFIGGGIELFLNQKIDLLEIGLGTALNAALTAQWAEVNNSLVNYHGIELHPLGENEFANLNYNEFLDAETVKWWQAIYKAEWNKKEKIHDLFHITKQNVNFLSWEPEQKYHLVYFDAFGPEDQPEMWGYRQFEKIYNALLPHGVLVTYSVKGVVRKTLADIGFFIERLQGPPGKRHFLRATKTP